MLLGPKRPNIIQSVTPLTWTPSQCQHFSTLSKQAKEERVDVESEDDSSVPLNVCSLQPSKKETDEAKL